MHDACLMLDAGCSQIANRFEAWCEETVDQCLRGYRGWAALGASFVIGRGTMILTHMMHLFICIVYCSFVRLRLLVFDTRTKSIEALFQTG